MLPTTHFVASTVLADVSFQGITMDAALAFIIGIAALITSAKVIHNTMKQQTDLRDLIHRELTGWTDPATGEEHPSLRAHIHSVASRLETVESATKQLHTNGGGHLADAIKDTQRRIAALEIDLRSNLPEFDRRKTTHVRCKCQEEME